MKIFKFCKNNKRLLFSLLLFVLSCLFLLKIPPFSWLFYVDIAILGISSIFNIYLFYPKRFKGEFSLTILFLKWIIYFFSIIIPSFIGLLWLNRLGWILQFRLLISWGLPAIILYLVSELFKILLNISLRSTILLFAVTTLFILFMGSFSIKQWALISGILMLWNYINSEEFIILLRNGKMEGVKIPSSLKSSWQSNKFLGYILTLLLYVSLIIAPFIESWIPKNKEPNDLFTKGAIRTYVFLVVSGLLGILIILLIVKSRKKSMSKKNINELIKLPRWKKFIATYQVLQIKNNKN